MTGALILRGRGPDSSSPLERRALSPVFQHDERYDFPMRTFGADRHRLDGERVILLSAIPKGWKARIARTTTSVEHPGTTVLWDEQYFEVIEAAPADGERVRYVLAPWREEHTIRTFEPYDEEWEARRRADYALAKKQQRASTVSRWSGMFLGHLPEPVQNHLQNELGVFPARMTILSVIPPFVLFGLAVFVSVDAYIKSVPSPVPQPLLILAALWFLESLIRFQIAMSQQRGVGSLEGTLLYLLFRALSPNRDKWPSLYQSRGYATFTLPPPDGVALRDALEMKGPLLTLLSRREQEQLATRHGFDYRRHAFAVTWVILVFSILGALTSSMKLADGASVSTLLSLFVALAAAIEQVLRLMQLQRGPAPSMFGVLVRPFVRDVFR
jgi:hypothetical protein